MGAGVVQMEFAFIHKVTKHANSIYLLRTVMVTLRPSDHHGNSDFMSICSRGSSVPYSSLRGLLLQDFQAGGSSL